MIMASHQIKYLSGQIKSNLLYVINGEIIVFAKGNECLAALIISIAFILAV